MSIKSWMVVDLTFSLVTFSIGVPFNVFFYRYSRANNQRVSSKACSSCSIKLAVIGIIGVGIGIPLHLLKHVNTSFNWLCTLHLSIAHSLHLTVSVALVMFHFQRTLAVSPTKTIIYLRISPVVREWIFRGIYILSASYFIVCTILFAVVKGSMNCDVKRENVVGDVLYIFHCTILVGVSIPCVIAFEALAINTYTTLKAHVRRVSTFNAGRQEHRKINVRKILWSLQVTAIYYILWFPLTILKLIQNEIDDQLYHKLLPHFQEFVYLGFAIIPFVYASLDHRFLRYIASKIPCRNRKNGAGEQQTFSPTKEDRKAPTIPLSTMQSQGSYGVTN